MDSSPFKGEQPLVKRLKLSEGQYNREMFSNQLQTQRAAFEHETRNLKNRLVDLDKQVDVLKQVNANLEQTNDDLHCKIRDQELEHLKQVHVLKDQLHKATKQTRANEIEWTKERTIYQQDVDSKEEELRELRAQADARTSELVAADRELQRLVASAVSSNTEQCDTATQALEIQQLKRELSHAQALLREQCTGPEEVGFSQRQAVATPSLTSSTHMSQLNEKLLSADARAEALEKELEHVKSKRDELLHFEVEIRRLEQEKTQWTSIFQSIVSDFRERFPEDSKHLAVDGAIDSSAVMQVLRVLQGQLVLENRSASSSSQANTALANQVQTLETEKKACEQQVQTLRRKLDEQTAALTKLEQAKRLFAKQQASTMEIIRTISEETTNSLAAARVRSGSVAMVEDDNVKAQDDSGQSKVQDAAEKAKRNGETLNELLQVVKASAQSLKSFEQTNANVSNKTEETTQAELKVLRTENIKLKKALDQSEDKLAQAERMLNVGEYNPATTKVLHFVQNPEKLAKEKSFDQLKSENLVLKAQLAELQMAGKTPNQKGSSLKTPGGGGGSKRSLTTPNTAGSSIDHQVSYERLKKLFREKTAAFREAVYLLTGFKIDMTTESNPKLRLRSMYGERQDDFLLFQLRNGGLELLETEFCSRIDPNVFAYLNKCNSVPAFLCTLTLDLFERQTFTMQ